MLPQMQQRWLKSYLFGTGGTSPDCIITNPAAANEIMGSGLFFLTDGYIADYGVVKLTQLVEVHGVIQVLVILVITGPRRSTPANANILVGISFFTSAPDAMILFQEDTTCYLSVNSSF